MSTHFSIFLAFNIHFYFFWVFSFYLFFLAVSNISIYSFYDYTIKRLQRYEQMITGKLYMAANKFHSQHSISSFASPKMIEKAMLMSGVVSYLFVRSLIVASLILIIQQRFYLLGTACKTNKTMNNTYCITLLLL